MIATTPEHVNGGVWVETLTQSPYVIAPNLGTVASRQVVEARVFDPLTDECDDSVRAETLAAIDELQATYYRPFGAVATRVQMIASDRVVSAKSIFVTTFDPHGLDARFFDFDQIDLMTTLQYAALAKALAGSAPIDQRPPHREPSASLLDFGNFWSSTVLRGGGQNTQLYTGRMKNGEPVISSATAQRITTKRVNTPRANSPSVTRHSYCVRPVITIATEKSDDVKPEAL